MSLNNVNFSNQSNKWANGNLNTNQNPPQYKGISVTGYSNNGTLITWTVPGMSHGGVTGDVTFSGSITGSSASGTASGVPLVLATASSDGWAADVVVIEGKAHAAGHGSHHS